MESSIKNRKDDIKNRINNIKNRINDNMKWIKNNFKLIVFLVVLLVSFFVFEKFWVDLINKFWVNPIASQIGCNIWWVLLVFSFVVIFIYILECCYSKTLNKKRFVIVLTFSAINILCFFSDNWEYTYEWTIFIIILPLILEFIFWLKNKIKNKENETQELEREKTIGIEDSYNRENIYNTSYETLQTCFYEEGSFSVAISGSWGSGKTVFMEKLKDKYNENKSVSIIEFEAWRCDTPNLIIRNFFTQLKNKLKIYIPNISLDFDKYIDLLLDDDSVKPLKLISKAIYNICKQGKDPYNEIKKELKKSKHKVVVFIDDVDRLDADEIKEVLRLIRNTADFPYIQFIFTCDKDYICETLKKKDIEKPELYLEKFINIEISLPKYEERIICEKLYSRISTTIKEVWGNNVADNEIKDMIYLRIHDCIDLNKGLLIPNILHSMRDVIRFNNSFYVILKALNGENKTKKDKSSQEQKDNELKMEFSDLFLVELLKYRFPKIYSTLDNSLFDLLEPESIHYKLKNDAKDNIKNIIENSENVDVVYTLLEELFNKNNREFAINKYYHFDKYFMYRIDKKRLTKSELLTLGDYDFNNQISELYKDKYDYEFEVVLGDILNVINKGQNPYSFNIIYNIIKKIIKYNNNNPLENRRKEIQNAVLVHLKNYTFINTTHLKEKLDLFNYLNIVYCETKGFDLPSFILSILAKNNLKTHLKEYNEEKAKEIVTNFLTNTKHKVKLTQVLFEYFTKKIIENEINETDLLLSKKEILNIQLNYFEKTKDKLSNDGINLFHHCIENMDLETKQTYCCKEALSSMKDAIKKNPNEYFKKFITETHIDKIGPFVRNEQIFESNEKFEEFLNTCNTDSIEEIRVKNFWELYKYNEYKDLPFNINDDLITKCFTDEISKLNQLKEINEYIEKNKKITNEYKTILDNNHLHIKFYMEVKQKAISYEVGS